MLIINDTNEVLNFAMKSSRTTITGPNQQTIHKYKDSFAVNPLQTGVFKLNRHSGRMWTLHCRIGNAKTKRQVIGILSDTKSLYESLDKNNVIIQHFLTQGYKSIV
jgi:hypothetical protein